MLDGVRMNTTISQWLQGAFASWLDTGDMHVYPAQKHSPETVQLGAHLAIVKVVVCVSRQLPVVDQAQ